ncbi:DUF4012 domain-containing protein [Lacisediminihabitans profunda]|uniref:DUF4012 domain-containing protein n=1 Tax=Lacisediminihabitans profunda TaxID=2594790 RepID=A0A5C8ULT3_9MICO|nr:DUF4012 domain-containing protein [Lacisediminihabitans profunda]TXN28814.1 DUF4012 domain-containing protein [Lacisediminihabitans profunda]
MAITAHGFGPRHTHAARNLLKRWWFWLIIAVVLLLIGTTAWIGTRALAAKSELEAAQTQVGQLKADLAAQKFSGLRKTMAKIEVHAAKARDLTSDPVWQAAESIPVAGKNLTVVRQLAAATDTVVVDAVAPLVKVASTLSLKSFAPVDGAINLAPLTAAVPAVAQAKAGIHAATVTLDGIDTSGTVAALGAAKLKLVGLLGGVSPLIDTANEVLPFIAPAMGSEKPRNYVVMFQNNAESRPLGGTALSFALVTMDKGKITLASTVSAGFDHFAHYPDSVIPVPDGLQSLYEGTFGTFIPNATVRPKFATAAQVTFEMWKRQFGTEVDGVISIDPVALSYILRATTPITLSSGDILTSDSLVPLLLNGLYQRFNTGHDVKDNASQDVIYGEAVAATFAKLSGGPLDPKLLLGAIMQSTAERRLLIWSAKPAEQAELEKGGFTGDLPVSDAKTDRVGVYFEDNVGSKLNYYLGQAVHLQQGVCRTDGRQTYRVGADLTSTVPANAAKALSPSILGDWKAEKVKPGVQRMFVFVYAPPGTQFAGATVNGAAVSLDPQHDEAYPVAKLRVSVTAGATVKITVDIVAAQAGTKALDAIVTPMVHAATVDRPPLDCATVTGK